jgi:hypothetical protein
MKREDDENNETSVVQANRMNVRQVRLKKSKQKNWMRKETTS